MLRLGLLSNLSKNALLNLESPKTAASLKPVRTIWTARLVLTMFNSAHRVWGMKSREELAWNAELRAVWTGRWTWALIPTAHAPAPNKPHGSCGRKASVRTSLVCYGQGLSLWAPQKAWKLKYSRQLLRNSGHVLLDEAHNSKWRPGWNLGEWTRKRSTLQTDWERIAKLI